MVSTPVPPLVQAGDGLALWGAAVFHATPGLAFAALSLWLLVSQLRDGQSTS